MTYPKMIVFDYGQTLLYEPGHDTLRGEKALFKYVRHNKNGLTAAQINDFAEKLFRELGGIRELGFDLHERQFQQLVYEYLEIELSVSLPEAEKIFWEGCSAGAVIPGADKLLDYLKAHGIRSGVISNIGYSGAALRERFDRLLPMNRFEFVIASSEYLFRKPSHFLFELALKKAGLQAGDVWFCGDNPEADVKGAASAGIFPVWYDNPNIEDGYPVRYTGPALDCEHLHISDWSELTAVLEELKTR